MEEKEIWNFIIVNGKFKQVQVQASESDFDKGVLKSIKNLKPFDREVNKREPTVEDANKLKRDIYSNFFRKPFKNLLVLSGAGSSIGIGEGDKVGLLMSQLWQKAENKYIIKDSEDIKEDGFKLICEAVEFDSSKWDLEALLSQIDGHCKFSKDKKVKLNEKDVALSEIRKQIFDLIKNCCSLNMPLKGDFPHKQFLEKLLQRKQTNPRVKVFTLNYDLLFEYAANEVNAIVIDGFSFTMPRTFSGRYFDYDIVQREGSKLQEEDNFIQRVFHLHKLHGSVNWERKVTENKNEVIISEEPKDPLMVYPREAKYEDSYEQPFFEMMARFQRNLRLNNDTILICIGYSFNDKHINAAILEALNQNPGFRLAVIDPLFFSDKASNTLKEITKAAMESERIMMISETFTDFANHFPEIKTYDNINPEPINFKNEQPKD